MNIESGMSEVLYVMQLCIYCKISRRRQYKLCPNIEANQQTSLFFIMLIQSAEYQAILTYMYIYYHAYNVMHNIETAIYFILFVAVSRTWTQFMDLLFGVE